MLKLFAIIFLILVVLYLLAIMPRIFGRPDHSHLMGVPYAHRGFHDNNTDAPENSMKAFRKAIDRGYGIELDVQLSKDQIPVIFHDETLKRLCGADGKVRDYTYQELQQFTLGNSKEHIPLLEDFLTLVDGRVPLIIEIKVHERASRVCTAADKLIHRYKGPYCIESFHPFALNWYRRNRPEVVRGQLSSNFREPGKREHAAMFLVHHLLLNFLGRPDFIAYNHLYKNNFSRKLCTGLFGALRVAWTIRSRKQMNQAKDGFSLFIFEGFVPKKEDYILKAGVK